MADFAALQQHLDRAWKAGAQRRELRAAEELSTAADKAAAALPADSLVTATLRLAACDSFLAHANPRQAAGSALSPADSASAVSRALDAWAAAAEALRARHAANTLLSCTRDEDAFFEAFVVSRTAGDTIDALMAQLLPGLPPLDAAARARRRAAAAREAPPGTAGYCAYLDAARQAARRMLHGEHSAAHIPSLTPAEEARWGPFVAAAPAVVVAARGPGGVLAGCKLLSAETEFVGFWERFFLPAAAQEGLASFRPLAAAWSNCGASALVARAPGAADDAEQHISTLELATATADAWRSADLASRGLRRCALPACGATEPEPRAFKLCGGCRREAYCSPEHARTHWKTGHKAACRAAAAGTSA